MADRLPPEVASLVALARAPLPGRERRQRLSEALRAQPALVERLRTDSFVSRISGDNSLKDLVDVLQKLPDGPGASGDLSRMSTAARAELARVARAVAQLVRDNGSTATCFFVAPDAVLTNYHVAGSKSDARAFRVRVDYARDGDPLVHRGLDPDRLFDANPQLDYALIGLDRPDPDRPTVALSRRGRAVVGKPAIIIQHPNGGPRQVGLRDNTIRRVADDRIYYYSDTTEGSSGSPVFDLDMGVIALHAEGGSDLKGDDGQLVVENVGVAIRGIAVAVRRFLGPGK